MRHSRVHADGLDPMALGKRLAVAAAYSSSMNAAIGFGAGD